MPLSEIGEWVARLAFEAIGQLLGDLGYFVGRVILRVVTFGQYPSTEEPRWQKVLISCLGLVVIVGALFLGGWIVISDL